MNKPIKQKKCKYCGDKYTPRKTTQTCCYESECIKKFLDENKPKINRVTEKRKREQRNEKREQLKTYSQRVGEVKVVFQRFIRLRDKGLPCISCGSKSLKVDGGHYKKAEIYSGVIFDEHNVHSQCQKCNRYEGGNEANYRQGLVERYGEKYVLELEKRANETRSYKYDKEELKEIKTKYQRLINQIK